ncbi:MAG TPA: GNAT family N-acetyltransferase [Pseudomonas sp.]|uniref:GNAT family N-acetyltransferase n=1 Tax=Pseudomonas sp. TaxID=306 RepID=UPI002ED82DD0
MKTQVVGYEALRRVQRQELELLELPHEQKMYAGDIFGALNTLGSTSEDHVRGFALLVDDTPRGFFLLKHGALLPSWADADAATLHALMIDVEWQGRGLGKQCVQGLPELVQTLWPDVRQLMLSVDAENQTALGLYLGLGWVDRGTAYRGRVGYERRMALAL